MKIKESELESHQDQADPLLGTVYFKQITYKIKILKLSDKVPTEFKDDFIEWLKSKALKLGLGKQCEYYYDHDKTGNSFIEVLFHVYCD